VFSNRPVPSINSILHQIAQHQTPETLTTTPSETKKAIMVGSRVLHILKKIPVGSIKAGDREVLTSIATQTEKYKRLDVAIESQTALMHETLLDCVDMIDPKTHHCVMTRVLLDYMYGLERIITSQIC
jgi:hypothetical protein